MALQSQSASPVAEFGALVRRQLWGILLPFAFITALGVMAAQLMPKTFEVTTLVKIPESGIPGTGNAIQRDVNSAMNDIKAEPLVRAVIESQEWSDYIELSDKEKVDYIRRVVKNITPKVGAANKNAPGSSYLTVTYVDAEGARAENFLNALRDRYIDNVVQSVRSDAKSVRDTYKDLRDQALSEYKAAEKAKADLIKLKNLPTTPPGGQGRNEDPVQASLTLATTQKDEAERELNVQKATLAYSEKLLAAEPESIPEEQAAALANAAPKAEQATENEKDIRALELGILEKREKLKDYRPLAKAYQKIEDEIAKDETKIALLKGDAPQSGPKASPSRFVPNPKRNVYEEQIRTIKGTIETLAVKINGLKVEIADKTRESLDRADSYLQLSYLENDVNRASATYTAANDAWSSQCMRVQLLEGPSANPFELVQLAVASDTPKAPNVPVFIIVSILLGLAGGLGWAITSEFLRNGFKGISDLTRGLAVPVLGAVNMITTRVQARRTMMRHAMIGASSLVIVGSILWITWAYQHDSLRLLGPQLTQVIDDVRLMFRP